MTAGFTSFVVFAGMRTGSNLLEATLNGLKGVTCFGEAFNPYMMGWPDNDRLLGFSAQDRQDDPLALLARILGKPDHLSGFRYFFDHDPRVFDAIIADRNCAKIILTRNPLDSYVSTRLAWETNQWKLNHTETPIDTRVTFDGDEFREMLDQTEAFHLRIMRALQVTGQAGFWLGYEDLRDTEVLTGMLHWLGRTDLEQVTMAGDQVPQNPRELALKLRNFDEMQNRIRDLDPFHLRRVPSFEPRRGPAVPSYAVCEAGTGLLLMPVKGAPAASMRQWLAALGPVSGGLTQNSLRQWKREHVGHRSFSVLRHPLARAWDAFLELLGAAAPELRDLMRTQNRVPLPPDPELAFLDDATTVRLFADFLGFLRRNLSGQTTLPTHPGWASQTEIIAGFSRFGLPDMLLREDRLAEDLAHLCRAAGIDDPHLEAIAPEPLPDFLDDKTLKQAAKAAYQKDYVSFGFDPR